MIADRKTLEKFGVSPRIGAEEHAVAARAFARQDPDFDRLLERRRLAVGGSASITATVRFVQLADQQLHRVEARLDQQPPLGPEMAYVPDHHPI